MHRLALSVVDGQYAICRLAPDAPLPVWAQGPGAFVAIARTRYELSIVCNQALVPEDVQAERDWSCLCVCGPLDHSLVGILASLATPLAAANVSIFAVATFDTDYLLIRTTQLDTAFTALRSAGHTPPRKL